MQKLKIKNIKKLETPSHVYDLSVGGTHNFFVGQTGIMTSNCDGMSMTAQQALRSIMEDYLDSVKFILTANYRNKLIEALRSRCQEFTFTCLEKQVLQRIVSILKSEKVVVHKENLENIRGLVKDFFPDIRKTINELQRCCITGTFIYSKHLGNDFAREIKENLKEGKDVFQIRQKTVDESDKFGNDYHSLMKDLFHLYVRECNSIASILISEYMYRHSFVMDPEVNFSALLFNLKSKL